MGFFFARNSHKDISSRQISMMRRNAAKNGILSSIPLLRGVRSDGVDAFFIPFPGGEGRDGAKKAGRDAAKSHGEF